jgi:hypothetical protein
VRDLSVWHRVCCVLVFIRHTPMMGTLSHGTSGSPREAGRIRYSCKPGPATIMTSNADWPYGGLRLSRVSSPSPIMSRRSRLPPPPLEPGRGEPHA